MKRILRSLIVGAGVWAAWQAPAWACGGLFCDSPPPDPFAPPPIAQTGENIVFGVTEDPQTGAQTVEAHIQIYYAGPADKFSWIVPVDAAPTLGVGTDRLFTTIAQLTRPQFSYDTVIDGTCKPEPPLPTPVGGSGGASAIAQDAAVGSGDGGLQVLSMGPVGPYETAVIHSTDRTSATLIKWLRDNGYFVGPDAISIIDEYVQENKYFVAIRLQNGKDVQSIQPVVLKFTGGEPCVPLRLTAIAAQNDLQINLWVLGAHRAVPKNYFELTLNEVKLEWLNGGSNYAALIKAAADEAGGNAFIAEYAGSARLLDNTLWSSTGSGCDGGPCGNPSLDTLRAQTTPPDYLRALIAQRLNGSSALLSLLRVYIPEPMVLKNMGISETLFYFNNQTYWDRYRADFAPFDPLKLTDEIDKAIVTPLRDAQKLLDAHPYLTRLATYISPIEMNRDPVFIFNDELPALSNVHKATARVQCGAQQFRLCDAPVRWDLPGGRSVWRETFCGRSGKTDGDLLQTPALNVAYQRAEGGEGTRVADNGALIDKALLTHNQAVASALTLPPSSLKPDGTPMMPLGGTGGAVGVSGGGGGCGCDLGEGAPLAASATVALLLGLSILRGRARRG